MTQEQKNLILESMVETLELPLSAYAKAKDRYEDLGKWFGRNESTLKNNDSHVFPQGSFRLGTAIKPLDANEEYDLDLACNLRSGVDKSSHTQCDLKDMIGDEIKSYRLARGIQSKVDEKHRCWRLEYQDELSFHMDIVPCIPLDKIQRDSIFESIQSHGINFDIAKPISESAISITDDRNDNYRDISNDWNISNPEGYAKWFEYNMEKGQQTILLEKAQVDDVPDFKYKTTLQRTIQLLKRHRDNMFKNKEDSKPISIIITTLATKAYSGETDLELAVKNILSNMQLYVKPNSPRIANPVNNDEDFTDRWSMPEYKYLRLEDNFWSWLKQAKIDFEVIVSSENSEFIAEKIENKFSLQVKKEALKFREEAPAIITGTTNISKTSGRQA